MSSSFDSLSAFLIYRACGRSEASRRDALKGTVRIDRCGESELSVFAALP